MRRNSRPDLNAELTVDRERFPYRVYLGSRVVASLYTHTLIDATRNCFKYFEEMNELTRQYNLLVDAIKGRAEVNPDEITYRKLLEVPHDTEGDDFFRAYGVKLGQVWKTKGSFHHYEVTDINVIAMEITLSWIGTYKYNRIILIEVLKKKYELVENANKAFIRAVTKGLTNG